MKQILIALGLGAGVLIGTFQPCWANESNPKRAFRNGKREYRRSDFIKATPYLKAAFNLDPNNAKYAYMLGKAVFLGDQPAQSMPYFIAAYNLDPTINSDLQYYLSRAMHLNGQYMEAIEHYKADLQRYELDDPRYVDNQMRIRQCEAAPKVEQMQRDYKIENLGEFLNSPYPDYAATFSENFDYMIFTTRRPRKVKQLAKRRHHIEDINEEVYESRLVNGVWTQTMLFEKPIPRWSHDASIKLAQGGNTLVYYMDNRNHGDVYISQFKEGSWSKRVSIGANVNSKEYNEPSVYISNDGQSLLWVSDRPGGSGMKDIYISRKEGADWGPGTNLGPNVNTPYDEDAPCLSPDGKKLYFASRGHNSMGGYDIFVCNQQPDGSWGKPENLGVPINSVGDDIYFVLASDGKSFYFSSDRPGGQGEKDIYKASPSKETHDAQPTEIAGTVLDRNSGKPLAAEVTLVDENGEEIGKASTNPTNGSYQFDLPGAGAYRLEVKADACSNGPLASSVSKPNVVSGIITDALTKEPLDAVVGLYDNNGNLTETMPTNPKTGNYMFPVNSGQEYTVKVMAKNYLPYEEKFGVKATGELIAHYEEIALQPLTENQRIVINWQFFDVGKSLLKGESIKDLDHVLGLMKKLPHMKLNIIGHTDADGNEDSNQVLSEDRAKAVAQYLVDRGVDPKRLNTTGMGESMPIASNDSETTKRHNRRVELYIIE